MGAGANGDPALARPACAGSRPVLRHCYAQLSVRRVPAANIGVERYERRVEYSDIGADLRAAAAGTAARLAI